MTAGRLDHPLSLVKEQIEKKVTRFGKSIPAATRLAITLGYFVFGETQQSLSHSYCIGRSTASNIVSDTWSAIYESFKDPYLKSPSPVNDCKCILERFEKVQNFLQVLMAATRFESTTT